MKNKPFKFKASRRASGRGLLFSAREGEEKQLGLSTEQKEELTNLLSLYVVILLAACVVAAAVT